MRLPAPVMLWVFLLAGHALVAQAPLPAAWEGAARAGACALAGLSLACGWSGARHTARVRAAFALERLEVLFGVLALIAAGGALAGEADRIEEPLPVHPRAVPVEIEGRVLDAVATDAAHPSFTLRVDSVAVGEARARCDAAVLVRFGDDGPVPEWALPGLSIRLRGRFRPLEDARNPGSGAPGRWRERAGIAGALDADPTSVVVVADAHGGGIPWSGLLRLRLARLFAENLSAPVAALARGMALGDRSGITSQIQDRFRDGGTIHILSISGLHVCVLAGIVAAMAVAFRMPFGPALALEMISLWGYVLLVGAPASAVRSAILWSAMRAGRLRGVPVRPFAAWGLAGLLIHLSIPNALEDPGFQLSFAAVLGLLASGGLRLGGGVLGLLQQSAFAEAGTLGIQVLQFGAVPVAGLFLNLAVIPLCSAFMAAMLLQLCCALLLPPLLPAVSGAVELSGLLMLKLTAVVARAVPPIPAREIPAPWLLAVSLALLLLAAAVWERARVERRPEDRRSARWAAVAALLAAWVAPFVPSPCPRDRATWILMLDVGQGDGTIVHERGGTLLVDAGPITESRDEGRVTVEPALRAEGITRVDAILSHAHRDHYGGLGWLKRRGFLRSLVQNGSDPRFRGITVTRDTALAFARIVRVSENGTAAARPGNAHENNRSLVAFVDLGGRAACFAGDAEHDAEMELLERDAMMPSAILKVPHHGSRTSSDSAWIAAVRPRVALISCGEGNRFGHPDRATVGRYLLAGARVYRTDREGAIRVTVTRRGALVSTRAHPSPELVPWSGNPP